MPSDSERPVYSDLSASDHETPEKVDSASESWFQPWCPWEWDVVSPLSLGVLPETSDVYVVSLDESRSVPVETRLIDDELGSRTKSRPASNRAWALALD